MAHVKRSFFICATPRSGSSLLSESLEFTSLAGRPREYFEPTYESDWSARLAITGDSEFLPKITAAGSTSNNVFGAKIHWHQFLHLRSKLRSILGEAGSDIERLRHAFPGLKYIFLTRRDKVLQAVSYVKAIQTDVWHTLNPEVTGVQKPRVPAPEPRFDVEQIDRWVRQFTEDEINWDRYFARAGIEPLDVVYEDFLNSYDSTTRAMLRYLEIPESETTTITPPRLQKLGDELSTEWANRYRTLKWFPQPLRGTTARASYLICTTPRTGGFLLAEALESTGVAGRPREYFDPVFQKNWQENLQISSERNYLETVLAAGTTSNGVFGAKVFWQQFEDLLSKLRRIHGFGRTDAEVLNLTIPNLRFVFLTRRDKLRQAISYDRAIRSGVWWSLADSVQQATQTEPPEFSAELIEHWVARFTDFENHWRRVFKRFQIEPIEVSYEDLCRDYESTIRAVLRSLEVPNYEDLVIANPRLHKQADSVTEEWANRFEGRNSG